jgi:hypothetical protein
MAMSSLEYHFHNAAFMYWLHTTISGGSFRANQTIDVIGRALLTLVVGSAELPPSLSEPSGSAIISKQSIPTAWMMTQFIFYLERQFFNARDGSVLLERMPKPSRLFFHANRKVSVCPLVAFVLAEPYR